VSWSFGDNGEVPPERFDNVLSWAIDLDEQTRLQAARAARLPFVAGYVALMPDAHWGLGATVGSVIPTVGALVPAAVGVDIGCGMVAARLRLDAGVIEANGPRILERIAEQVPAGLGRWRSGGDRRAEAESRLAAAGLAVETLSTVPDPADRDRIPDQLGTLGSGNHFIEVCADEEGRAWVVLHSGSRGIGNRLAQMHIERAKGKMRDYFTELEDPDLAYLVEGTPEFEAYVNDLLWAQRYALANREWMTDLVCQAINLGAGDDLGEPVDFDWVINCHHNYAALEHHHGHHVWVTRKGAIRAGEGEYGVVPGSMGTGAYIVRGKGSEASFTSAAHGAGRRLSRRQARRRLSAESLRQRMGRRTWLASAAHRLVDEHPDAYKDLEEVMEAQADLVEPVHRLRTVLNYKGV
jgi:tRNA-splicing ligase RtcB